MYYVKTRINDELEVKIDLTGDNIFTTCPECGAEFPIDIIEMAQVEHFDFYSTNFYCDECSQKLREERDAT